MTTFRPLLLSLALVVTLPALAAPPDHAPAHGYRAKHEYVYYREREIYYEPARALWFWIDGGDWRVGARLPAHYQQYTTGGVRISLDSDRPYTEHRHVVERHGRGGSHPGRHKGKPQEKSHGKSQGKGHGKGHDKGRGRSHGNHHD